MASRTLIAFLIFYVSVLNLSISGSSDKNNSTFVPTHQWKKIENGQAIPTGLHVRINLHTGEKEAKLPDSEDNSKKSLIATGDDSKDTESEKVFDSQKLKTLLKNIQGEGSSSGNISKNFSSYEKLKEDFSKLQLEMKTDVEIIKQLLEKFKKFNLMKINNINEKNSDWTDEREILNVLGDLEYLVHQYDNAQEFAKLNGFSDVIYECLNSTSNEIRLEALRLLGSATQSNPKVQVAAVNSGALNLLLKILVFDENVYVRSRSVFALSCLIRKFPAAQFKFLRDGGLAAFAKVFDEDKGDLLKLQVKIITLIHDLLFERKDAKLDLLEEESKNQSHSKIEFLKERLQQYKRINLEKILVEQDWCIRVSDWFINQNHVKNINKNSYSGVRLESVNLEAHDLFERVVDTLYVLSDICKSQFQEDKTFLDILITLKDVYGELALVESNKNKNDDDANQFYTGLFNVLRMLIEKLKGNVHSIPKDEL